MTCTRVAHPGSSCASRLRRQALCYSSLPHNDNSPALVRRRDTIHLIGLALSLEGVCPSASLALPRGGIDARVAAAFNTAFAAGGDAVV